MSYRTAAHHVQQIDKSFIEVYGSNDASMLLRALKEIALVPAKICGLLMALFPILAVIWTFGISVAMK